MTPLPDSWTVAQLGSLLSPQEDGRVIHQGWSPRCDKEPRRPAAEWGVLKTTAIQDGEFQPEHNKRLPEALEPRPHLEVRSGDLLLTNAGPRARCGVATLVRSTPPRLMLSGKMYRLRFDHGQIVPKFVELFLRSAEAQAEIDRMKTGISDSGLNLTQKRFKTLEVPLPPFVEQIRIVAAIEEHFSHLDAAEALLDRALRNLDRLRRAALDSIPTGPRVELGGLLREKLRNGLSAKRADDGDVRVLTLTAVTENRFVDENTKLIKAPASRPVEDLWLEPGDVLVQRSNTPELVGTAAMYRGEPRWAIFPDLLIRVRPDERLVPEYLELVLQSTEARQHFRSSAQGIAGSMPKISQSTIETASIPLPPVEEQEALVATARTRRDQIAHLSGELTSARRRARALRRGVLAAAFSGQLVPQDPADEPASMLLDRIRAEAPGKKKSTRKKKSA